MKVALYKTTCARNGIPIMDSLAKYLKSDAIIVEDNNIVNSDVAVIWSILWSNKKSTEKLSINGQNIIPSPSEFRKQVWDHCRVNNIPVLVLEVGGLIRNKTWKFGINGINASGIFNHKNSPPGRFEKFRLEVKPWIKNDGYIVICAQNENSGAWTEGSMTSWVLKTISQIRKYTDRNIIIRPHPRAALSLPPIENVLYIPPKFIGHDTCDFNNALKHACAIISYNSNPAIEAVLNGIPVFTHSSSLCWEVSNPDFSTIEDPILPDRTQWLNDIAYTEWFQNEIEDGIPWKRLFK